MVKQAGNFVSYLRVSTDKQGLRGLGIAAQCQAVLEHLDGGKWQLVAEFVEQESGKRSDRPELAEGDRHLQKVEGHAGDRAPRSARAQRRVHFRSDGAES